MNSPYYIHLGARYGNIRNAEFSSLSDILAHMDRFGIGQTTATCIAGSPSVSNKQLLKDIAGIPGAPERVIPAFDADPRMEASPGEVLELRECLQTHRPACLMLRPSKMHFRLREIEWVLRAVADLRMPVLLRWEDLDPAYDTDDLISLALRFRDIPFIVQRVAWGSFGPVYDAMHRADNIYMDNAWLHTRGGIELVRNTFGSGRLLFSLGPRSNAGAAIAALARCSLPQGEKDSAASDSFIRLFAEEKDRAVLSARRRTVPDRVINSYWHRFLHEEPITDATPIDMHSHLGPVSPGWFVPSNRIEEQVDTLRRDMDRFGISMFVSVNSNSRGDAIENNRLLQETAGKEPDRFRGYVFYDAGCPERYTDEYLDSLFSGNYFVGFKSLPGYIGIDIADKRYEPMFRYADAHGLPILLHTWEGRYGTAAQCAEAAKHWPNAKVILGHTGGGTAGRRECERIAQAAGYDNVYFEFCGSFLNNVCWEDTLQKIDYTRVLYGTDTYLHDIAWELGRLLSMDIPDDRLRSILGGNARRILGL